MLEVIGSGFGRTGTLSLKHALEQLGLGPCYHMQEVLRRPSHIDAWHDAAFGRPVDWQRLFAPFGSAVDFPSSVRYEELLEAFPDAVVVHTVRDPQRWYDSTYETIYQARTMLAPWFVRSVRPAARWLEMGDALIWDGLFDGRFEDRDRAIEIYEQWNDTVRRTVPADRLLVFEVAQGWQPLCAFVGREVPETPFPHVNDRDQMLRRIGAARIATRAVPYVAGAAALTAAAALAGRRTR